MIVVSDSSPLILIAKIGCLETVEKMYKNIFIPEAVYIEVIEKGKKEGYSDAFIIEKDIGKFIFIKKIQEKFKKDLNDMKRIYGKGESESIILCIQEKADLLLIDDYEPRKTAESKNIKCLSTPGILLVALKKNIINLDVYIKKIGELSRHAWLSGDVVAKFLEAGYKIKGG